MIVSMNVRGTLRPPPTRATKLRLHYHIYLKTCLHFGQLSMRWFQMKPFPPPTLFRLEICRVLKIRKGAYDSCMYTAVMFGSIAAGIVAAVDCGLQQRSARPSIPLFGVEALWWCFYPPARNLANTRTLGCKRKTHKACTSLPGMLGSRAAPPTAVDLKLLATAQEQQDRCDNDNLQYCCMIHNSCRSAKSAACGGIPLQASKLLSPPSPTTYAHTYCCVSTGAK